MKMKLDFHGIIFEMEKKPMQESRFRLLYTLAAAALYVCMAISATDLCGFLGLLVIAVDTIIVFAIKEI